MTEMGTAFKQWGMWGTDRNIRRIEKVRIVRSNGTASHPLIKRAGEIGGCSRR